MMAFRNLSYRPDIAAAMSCLCLAGISFSISGGFPSRVDSGVLKIQALLKDWDQSRYCLSIAVAGTASGAACQMGESRGGSYDFVLWGDSHAYHFLPAISTLAKAQKLSGVLLWKGGCHPFADDPYIPKDCREFNAAVTRWLGEHPVRLVILSAHWMTRSKYMVRYLEQKDPRDNAGGLASTLAFLKSKRIDVAVLDHVTDFPRNVSLCVARAAFYKRDIESCTVRRAADIAHKVVASYLDYLQKHYNFSVVNLADALCDGVWCRAYDGKSLLMQDSHHLSEAGSLHIMPYLKIPMLMGAGKAGEGLASTSAKEMPPL